MANKHESKIMCGNVDSALPSAPTNEKDHAVAGEEFGESQGRIAEIKKSLHGASAESRSFASCLGGFFRTLGHDLSRIDPGTCMKKDHTRDGHSLMPAHANDFLAIGMDPEPIIEALKMKFDNKHDESNPAPCLGLAWETSDIRKVKIHNQKHAKEWVSQLESSLGIQLKRENVPAHPECCLELDESGLLAKDEIAEH